MISRKGGTSHNSACFRLVDNLPCATKYELENGKEIIYENGYRLGWEQDGHYFVNNYLDIVLRYHQPSPSVYRVVGFEVQPGSIDSKRFSFNGNHPVHSHFQQIFWPFQKLKSLRNSETILKLSENMLF